MANGFPVKANYATGDILTATNMNELSATLNYLQYMPPRNFVLNSAMNVWQRGTSISAAASSNNYTADRWLLQAQPSQASTVSRQATGDTTNLPNIQYCARVQRNSGQTGTGTIYFVQNFETLNSVPLAGKSVTISFYARAGANYSPTSSYLTCQIISGTGTDQNVVIGGFTGQTGVISQNATLTTTWQRFSYTGTIPTNSTQIATLFGYTPTGTAGAADYFEVTGVQLEIGSYADNYYSNQPTYQGELAACQRYYQRMTADATAVYKTFSTGWAASTTAGIGYFYTPVTMRVTPTSVDYSTLQWADGANAGVAVTAVAVNTSFCGNQVLAVDATVASGLTQYRPYMLRAANSSTAYLGFNAEL